MGINWSKRAKSKVNETKDSEMYETFSGKFSDLNIEEDPFVDDFKDEKFFDII